jgi:polyphosphate kinase
VAYLHDDRDAWDLQADGRYKRTKGAGEPQGHGAQAALMARYAARAGEDEVRAWT